MGVHLTLVGERPLSPPERVRSLVTPAGTLVRGYRAFAVRYFGGRLRLEEVERELRAQIERLLAARLRPVHTNGHQHLHVLPGIFDVVLRLCEEYGIGYVRIPSEPAPPPFSARAVALSALNALARRARERLARSGAIRANDRTIGIAAAGHLRAAAIARAVAGAEGVVELVTHPGADGDAIAGAYDWGFAWEEETAALCDPRLRAAIESAGVTLGGVRPLLA